MFEMTTQRFAEIATHKDENLIRSTFDHRRTDEISQELLGELSRKVGMSENHSELDYFGLRYGMEFFPEYSEKYNDEREKVFSHGKCRNRNRINTIIGNIEEQNGDNQPKHSRLWARSTTPMKARKTLGGLSKMFNDLVLVEDEWVETVRQFRDADTNISSHS